jgi:hypothetical protein
MPSFDADIHFEHSIASYGLYHELLLLTAVPATVT